jgi:UDP-3-O-[3-hydroxymyristoyl] glucosamine N-acyltransferase
MRKIHPSAVVYPNVKLGKNVAIGANSVIGGEGFGFDRYQRALLGLAKIALWRQGSYWAEV